MSHRDRVNRMFVGCTEKSTAHLITQCNQRRLVFIASELLDVQISGSKGNCEPRGYSLHAHRTAFLPHVLAAAYVS